MAQILVHHVDDDDDELEIFSAIIQELGYKVQSFRKGQDLIAEIKADNIPDIIFIDIYMPEMTVIDLAESLSAIPIASNLPMIAISGIRPSIAMSNDLRKFGVNLILEKPTSYKELKRITENTIKLLLDVSDNQEFT